MKKYDVIIIGSGIAGISASIYLKRSNIDFKEFATYQEFRAFMAEHLGKMREKNYFKDYDSYAFILK